MPINASDNKNLSSTTSSSTNDIKNIKIREVPSTSNSSLNIVSNNVVESYDLDEPVSNNEGILNRNDLDFSRIGSTAGNVKDGNFINVKNPEYWGDTGDLTYKIRDDGTVAISEDGVVLGFTDLQGIRIKEADSSKEEQIVKQEASNITSDNTKEIEENIQILEETIEPNAEQVQVEDKPQENIVEKEITQVPVETLEETTKETNVQEEIVVEPQVEQPINPQVEQQEIVENPPSTTETSINTVVIPSNIRQTGIIKNYTNYSYYYGKWNKGSAQERVAEMWNEAGRKQNNGIATLNGRYLVAVSPIFGTNGDIIDVVLDNGTIIPCIIGDAKGSDATNQYGHVFGSSVDVIEWESFGSKEDIVIDEWADKNVVQIINKGSIFSN